MTPQFRDRRASLLVTANCVAPTCHTALLSLVIKVPRTPKGSRMTLSLTQQAAQALAQASSLAVFATMAIWYVAPWLNSRGDRKSTRLNSSHQIISYAVFCL